MADSRTVRKRGKQSYAGIPRALMETTAYFNLSASAVRLLIDLAYQYRGGNNGNLTASWAVLRHRGWKSNRTLISAKDELVAAGFVLCTREGRFMNPGGRCALYALAWCPIDECPGKDLDVGPTVTPRLRLIKTPSAESEHSSVQKVHR